MWPLECLPTLSNHQASKSSSSTEHLFVIYHLHVWRCQTHRVLHTIYALLRSRIIIPLLLLWPYYGGFHYYFGPCHVRVHVTEYNKFPPRIGSGPRQQHSASMSSPLPFLVPGLQNNRATRHPGCFTCKPCRAPLSPFYSCWTAVFSTTHYTSCMHEHWSCTRSTE